ncbi:unnamed protein product [Ilex paraguariensis]|uniref:Uncharacterized protein n=1 Tax=Ilex paraguariensis TaxID=185542 RepID=A0ABC8UCF9_9AQUA
MIDRWPLSNRNKNIAKPYNQELVEQNKDHFIAKPRSPNTSSIKNQIPKSKKTTKNLKMQETHFTSTDISTKNPAQTFTLTFHCKMQETHFTKLNKHHNPNAISHKPSPTLYI